MCVTDSGVLLFAQVGEDGKEVGEGREDEEGGGDDQLPVIIHITLVSRIEGKSPSYCDPILRSGRPDLSPYFALYLVAPTCRVRDCCSHGRSLCARGE